MLTAVEKLTISHLQQEDVPEKMQETRELWEHFRERKDISIVVSDLVVREISQCKEPKRSFLLNQLSQLDYTLARTTDEERKLALLTNYNQANYESEG